jgi:hypothetical protein
MKFGFVNTINPIKIPENQAIRNNIVMIQSLQCEGLFTRNFDFMALLTIERMTIYNF